MKHSQKYYTLVASLPHLPRIGQVGERIPINRSQLIKRLKMLDENDRETVKRAWEFIAWEKQDPLQSDEEIVTNYQKLVSEPIHPALRDMIDFRMGLRTVLAGLRRRLAGEQIAPSDNAWGISPWVLQMKRQWNDPDFGLSGVFPWISQLRVDLTEGKSLQVDQCVMELVWDSLDRLSANKNFQIENVLAFIFKWDILERWLARDQVKAREQIESLTDSLVEAFRSEQLSKTRSA